MARTAAAELLPVQVLRWLLGRESALSTQPCGALPGLPVGTMRGCELPLVLLVLVLCQAPRGPAAPVPAAGETVLAKMYPRGSHWAVGECPARSSPPRDQPELGAAFPSLRVSGARLWGLRLLRPVYPNANPFLA